MQLQLLRQQNQPLLLLQLPTKWLKVNALL
jgi:hypothetical protein